MAFALNRSFLGRAARSASVVLVCWIASLPAQAQSYTWQNVQIVGGGYVDGIIAHPAQQGLFYARTDVGGSLSLQCDHQDLGPVERLDTVRKQ
jgi:hypothetical protein